MKAPPVGSSDFRSLAFQDQLELVSLKLFHNREYIERVGGPGDRPSSGSFDPSFLQSLQYPDNPTLEVADLPVSFLKDYWAGYICSYREDWYLSILKGATPLDEYDIKVGYMENLRTFTFPLLSLISPLFYILSWVSIAKFRGLIDADAVLDACKVYVWLALNDRGWGHLHHDEAERVYLKAMLEYKEYLLFEDLNGFYPMIEESDESLFLEQEEFVIYPTAQVANCRYFYPMIPNDMYATQKFSVKGWGFIDPPDEDTPQNDTV